MSHWFYLLTVGGSGTNTLGTAFSVAGIGIDKAAKISYYAQKNYMTYNETYQNVRTHLIQAATYFYGNPSPEVISVTNAWHAVGVCSSLSTNFTNQTVTNNLIVAGCDINVQNVTITNGATLSIIANGTISIHNVTITNNSKLILNTGVEVNSIIDLNVHSGSQVEIYYP